MKLVWPNSRRTKGNRDVQRRSMLDGSESKIVPLSNADLDSTLEALGELEGDSPAMIAGPFTVFQATGPRSYVPTHRQEQNHHVICSSTSQGITSNSCSADCVTDLQPPNLTKPPNAIQTCQDNNSQVPRALSQFLEKLSTEERFLMHGWVTHTSAIMLPIRFGSNNPLVQAIYTMTVSPPPCSLAVSSQSALRYGIYALAAFNRAQIYPENSPYQSVALKFYQRSLQYLRQSLEIDISSQRAVVLCAILVISSIGIVIGNSSDWRVHLSGAREWVFVQGSSFWNQNQDMSLIYQLFLLADGVGSLPRHLKQGSEVTNYYSTNHNFYQSISKTDRLHDYYRLDALFGITLPLLEIITDINRIAAQPGNPQPIDVDMLEMRIFENEPSFYSTEGASIPCSEALRHTYYYACLIHLKRTLRKVPPSDLEGLVEQIVNLLGTPENAEDDCNLPGDIPKVPYPVWPIFIAACETGDDRQRQILVNWLRKGRLIGLGNMLAAASIVEELWRRRKEEPLAEINWYDVMLDLNLDVLLL